MTVVLLHNVTLNVANTAILQGVDWQIHAKDRIALVGRNGAGKSTLLNLLQGHLVQDSGQVQMQQGLRVAGLAQDVPLDDNASIFSILTQGLGEAGETLVALRQQTQKEDYAGIAESHQRLDDLHAWDCLPRVETIASHLSLPLDAIMRDLSGGMKRRVLLAAALVTEPDLLLLDEPTNHLDLPSIEWLEFYLASYSGALVLVTHDRSFLSKIATKIVDLDRGRLQSYDCSYETFLERRDAFRLSEQKEHALFDKRLAEEEAWIRTGIKARRTRNEGRVRALETMRDAYQQRRQAQGSVTGLQTDVQRSGSLVIEAQHVNYEIQGKKLIEDFSLVLHRGEKLGIIGPNGCGKTTLVRLLLGELEPYSGQIRRGTALEIAYFDQLRRQLDPSKTVMANVADGAEHVTIQGKSKHVASYLQDFLFSPHVFQQPVSSLSGGECNRLLLAKLLAKPANVLVLDEPTNDLDIETLELLETLLVEYAGTVLLISHDRAFINRVVTSVLVYEEDQRFHEYLGGYDTYQQYKLQQVAPKKPQRAPVSKPRSSENVARLTYQEQRELARMPQSIEALEQKIHALTQTFTAPEFYQRSATEIARFQKNLAKEEAELAQMYERWETLESQKGLT